MKTEEIALLHTQTIQKSFQEQSLIREEERRRNSSVEEIHLWNAILICFVIFQVLLFVFPLFCNHLADQKYP